jgi:hypothetical protein
MITTDAAPCRAGEQVQAQPANLHFPSSHQHLSQPSCVQVSHSAATGHNPAHQLRGPQNKPSLCCPLACFKLFLHALLKKPKQESGQQGLGFLDASVVGEPDLAGLLQSG